jgi:hypothetical protein
MGRDLAAFPWPDEWVSCFGEAKLYLEQRGLTGEEIAAYAVSDTGRDWLAVFPIVEDGQLAGWQGRNINGRTPKCESGATRDGWTPCHKLVWGIDRIYPGKPCYVAEGVFDALYFDYGVATMGSALHETQVIKILDRRPSEIVVVAQLKDEDNDTAEARARGFRSFTDLPVSVKFNPHPFEDFGDMLGLRVDSKEKEG